MDSIPLHRHARTHAHAYVRPHRHTAPHPRRRRPKPPTPPSITCLLQVEVGHTNVLSRGYAGEASYPPSHSASGSFHGVPPPAPAPAATGTMRPWFGAVMKFVDEAETGRQNNLAQIYKVDEGSPAYKAGLQNEDIIRTWDGTLIEGDDVWRSLMRGASIGQRVDLEIIRDGQRMPATVTLEGTNREKTGRHTVHTSTMASTGAAGLN